MYANVLIMENPGNFDQILTYSIPATLKAEAGSLVLVPVRRQFCKGIILSFQEERPALNRIKEIKQVLPGESFVTKTGLQLAHWIAEYYVCSLNKAISLFLPPPVRMKEKLIYLLNKEVSGGVGELLLQEQERKILELLRKSTSGGLTSQEIGRRLGQPVQQELTYLLDNQFITLKKFFVPQVTSQEQVVFGIKEGKQKIAVAEQEKMLKRAPRQKVLFEMLREKPYSVAELKEKGVYNRAALQALAAKNLIEISRKKMERNPLREELKNERPSALNMAQKQICEKIGQSLQGGQGKWLLYGVTGSGKTEVYLHVMEKVLAQEKQVLYLVPEIALTPQIISLLVAVFGEKVAVLHSALSPGERHDEWRKIQEGRASVVLGPRSAVFAPFSALGLIIIDEEHEHTYKQNEPDPRYDARCVAEKLAELTGAVLVMGSATPSLRSFLAASKGEYGLLTLPYRVASRPLPVVEIIDMKKEIKEGNSSIFSTKLLESLRRTFKAGEQAILFINRRGFHTYVMCRECGKPLTCPRCNITLNYHRAKGRLVCHYCNYVRVLPKNCPFCGSTYVRYFGTGTERVAEELAKFFPAIPFIRMDTDTTQKIDSHARMLKEFQEGKARVLIGTQMIAKGLDFPQVTLVGIVNPDFLLNMPDYQAGERSFQLMTQVAGRAGRGKEPGKVLIQTYNPEHYLFPSIVRQNYSDFYQQEIANRQMLQYPPFVYLARILVSGYNEKQVKQRIQLWVEVLKKQIFASEEGVELLGPGLAPLGFLKKRFRYHIIIKSNKLAVLQSLTRQIREKAQEYGGEIRTVIDIEPQSLL